ncbi:MAG: hypothetical protein ACI9VM_000711 [Candidatus Azotimanducaceae bacterium]|jgi:hypothetical protein
MNEEQINYVVDQLKAGTANTDVRAALISAGYPTETIDTLFQEAQKRMQAVPPAIDTSEGEIQSETTLSTPHEAGSHTGLIIVVLIGILVVGGSAFAAISGLVSMPGFVANIFDKAPYEEESLFAGIQEGLMSVTTARYKASFDVTAVPTKDDDVYLLPEVFSDEFDTGMADAFAFLPSDFSFLLSISGDTDLNNTGALTTHTQLVADYITDDFSMNADVELVLDEYAGAYFRINRMPSLFFLDISSIKGFWVHVIDQPLREMFGEAGDDELVADELIATQLQHITQLADKHQVLRVVGEPVTEEINGEQAYKYTLALNQPTLRAFFDEAIESLEAEFGDNNMWTDEEMSDLLENLDSVTSAAYVDFLNTHMKVVVWAGSDGIPVQFGVEGRIAVDDDVSLFGLNIGPDDDSYKIQTLNAAQDLADDFSNLGGVPSYEGFCESDSFFWFEQSWEYNCNDSVDAYAIEVLLNESSHCVDNVGYRGEGSLETVSDRQCDSSISNLIVVEDSVPPEAERQVNVSMLIELTKINEPVAVEIPEDAMNIEEASESVPMLGMLLGVTSALEEARDKGADAAVKSNLNSARVQAEIYYDDNDASYLGLCAQIGTGDSLQDTMLAIEEAGGDDVYCIDDTDSYMLEVSLPSWDGYWCIDSTGVSQENLFSQAEVGTCNE